VRRVSAAAAPERVPERAPERAATQMPAWRSRLFCVFAEGVSDLSRLRVQQRAIDFPRAGSELMIGRTAQPATLWDALVPDPRLRGTVSREHFKVIAQGDLAEQQLPTFSLLCLSANGLLLNGTFVRNSDGLRRLQHGDIVAFAANLEPAERSTSDREGAAGTLPRKPFIAFTFELPSASAAEQQTPAIAGPQTPSPAPRETLARQSTPQALEEEDEMPAPRPPEGTVAGKWRTSKASVPLDSVAFCLEVHGEHVRRDLPSEARQLLYCNESSSSSSSPPALHVGRHYQRGFWRRVMKSEFSAGGACQFLDPDHFEIRVIRRSNPATREQPEWHYRVRVLASAGLTVNYSTVLNCRDERELRPSDTLTVATPPGPEESTHIGLRPLQKGFHFTFIPYMGSFSSSPQASGVPREAPRRLPDFPEPDEEADGDGCLVVERTPLGTDPRRGRSNTSLSDGAAGALRPWLAVSFEGEGERPVTEERSSTSSAKARHYGSAPMKTVLLEPMDGDAEEDDLFSKTGFGTSPAEGLCALPSEDKMPSMAESPKHRQRSAADERGAKSAQRQQEESGQANSWFPGWANRSR